MFNNLCECSPEETQRQMDYLSSTPVSGIAQLLRSGRCVLKKGIVCSLQFLGNLKTEFGQIGLLTPGQRNGEEKFLVSEIVPMLRANPIVSDGGLLNKIEAIMEREAKNEIEFNITLMLWNGETIVKDGNKRTIAFFENRKNLNQAEVSYEVYLVVPAQNSVYLSLGGGRAVSCNILGPRRSSGRLERLIS